MLLCGEEWFYIQCVLMLCDFWPYVQVSKLLRSCRKEGTETLGTIANLVALRKAQDISRLGGLSMRLQGLPIALLEIDRNCTLGWARAC